jgi:hypothetical protein
MPSGGIRRQLRGSSAAFLDKGPANGVANVTSAVMLNIWDTLKENNIEIPFPKGTFTWIPKTLKGGAGYGSRAFFLNKEEPTVKRRR